MALLRALRSLAGVLGCLAFLGLVAPLSLYLVVVPWIAIQPSRLIEIGSAWVTWVAKCLVALCRLGGARIQIEGHINYDEPAVVIMNHQSVIEVAPLIYIFRKRLPRFVARARYARWIPTVSRAIRYLDCIVVDPKRDRAGAVAAMKRAAAQGLKHAVMLFPEGHRTLDGEIRDFRPAGTIALLQSGPMPVYVVVGDGFWKLRRVVDSLFGLGSVRGRIRVVECVMSPQNPDDLPAFVEERRQVMIRELARMRSEAAA